MDRVVEIKCMECVFVGVRKSTKISVKTPDSWIIKDGILPSVCPNHKKEKGNTSHITTLCLCGCTVNLELVTPTNWQIIGELQGECPECRKN